MTNEHCYVTSTTEEMVVAHFAPRHFAEESDQSRKDGKKPQKDQSKCYWTGC